MNKTEILKKLSTKFADFGTVIDITDDGKFCAVLMKSGTPALYSLSDLEDDRPVKQDKFLATEIKLATAIEGEAGETIQILCSADSLLSCADTRCEQIEKEKKEIEEDKEAAEKKCNDLSAKLSEMEKTEEVRRCSEMEKALETIKEKSEKGLCVEQRVSDEDYKVILASIQSGEFSNCVDSENKFNGVQVVEEKFAALSWKRMQEYKDAQAEKKKHIFAWDEKNANNSSEFDPEDIAAEFTMN
ncbi:MAG: hypothetical protein AB9836_04515 [Aminipila sp.]